MTGRERVLALLGGALPERLPLMPITMMFASDQFGSRYREYVTDHRVMVEAQVKVAETFDFDYVSVISDPAREAADLGAAVEYFDNQPPAIVESRALLADKAALKQLRIPDPSAGGRMYDRIEGVRLLREQVGSDLLVEGWVEGPCAEAADLRGINTLMIDFIDDEAFVRDLFEFVVEMNLKFAGAQIRAGADIIGVGDAAASLVGPAYLRGVRLALRKEADPRPAEPGGQGPAAHLRQHEAHSRWHGPGRQPTSWTSISPPRWLTPAPPWVRTRCCLATSIRCGCCSKTAPRRSAAPSPNATTARESATSWAPAARSPATPRPRT